MRRDPLYDALLGVFIGLMVACVVVVLVGMAAFA